MTTADMLVPAAQYLRMSTEHQKYSLENQAALIEQYAATNGFSVVQTYTDAAKSGVVLKNRHGLRQLLKDVVDENLSYKAILVYDVSRWGRFQDTDESAHYEFLCKSAGVPVYYCAETFSNDGTLPSLMMKALKRTMAGEYSHELSVKVFDGHKRLAQLGFKQGGRPGYGLRRMLVSPDRVPKQILKSGEWKNIVTDRVILTLGPPQEVQIVRDIFRMLISERKTVHAIARELNREGVPYTGISKWDYMAVYLILTHPKYSGCHVYGRTSQKFYGPSIRLPREQWTMAPKAFEAIIDEPTLQEAQRILRGRTFNKSNDELLDMLRSLLLAEGRLSFRIIQNSALVPSFSAYRYRFGGLRQVYQLIGYGGPANFGPIDIRRRTRALRDELMAQIQSLFPDQLSIVRKGGRWRTRLKLRKNGSFVSVVICRNIPSREKGPIWIVDSIPNERKFPTLVARLNVKNNGLQDLYLFPTMDHKKRIHVAATDPWWKRGKRLSTVRDFCEILDAVRSVRSRGGSMEQQLSGIVPLCDAFLSGMMAMVEKGRQEFKKVKCRPASNGHLC